jgi:hypothetical protein
MKTKQRKANLRLNKSLVKIHLQAVESDSILKTMRHLRRRRKRLLLLHKKFLRSKPKSSVES